VKIARLLEAVESVGHDTKLVASVRYHRDGNHRSVSGQFEVTGTHPVVQKTDDKGRAPLSESSPEI